MRLLILLLSLFANSVWAATQYICESAAGNGSGSSLANCKAAGTNFASITVGASDVLRICSTIRGALTITSTNDVTVDLDCNDEAAGEITGADVVTAFAAVDENGEYATTDTFLVPFWVLVDGVAWKEGVEGSLADNEWAFNSAAGGTHEVYLGSDPTGRTVEIATRGVGVEFITSTGGIVTGGRIYGTRHTGSATGNGAVNCRASTCAVTGTEFYAVRKPTDVTGNATMTVTNTRTSYCGDGPDANKNTDRPSLTATGNLVEDCGYGGWFDNTATSHALTIDGEGIACTNCASFIVGGNTTRRTYHGIAARVETAAPVRIYRNYIEDTQDDGLNLGCTNSSGVWDLVASSNIMRRVGSGGDWSTSSFAVALSNGTCGNGSSATIANNVIADSASGLYFQAAASQTGTIRQVNNVISNVDPENATGTHYFVNWNAVNASHSLTLVSDYGDYHQSYGVGFFRWIAGASARAYSAFSTYKTDSSQDAASILNAPRFRGGNTPTTADGFIPTELALRASGVVVGDLYDFYGVTFQTKPSIGAFELRGPRMPIDRNPR